MTEMGPRQESEPDTPMFDQSGITADWSTSNQLTGKSLNALDFLYRYRANPQDEYYIYQDNDGDPYVFGRGIVSRLAEEQRQGAETREEAVTEGLRYLSGMGGLRDDHLFSGLRENLQLIPEEECFSTIEPRHQRYGISYEFLDELGERTQSDWLAGHRRQEHTVETLDWEDQSRLTRAAREALAERKDTFIEIETLEGRLGITITYQPDNPTD